MKEKFKDDNHWGTCKNDLAKIEIVTTHDSIPLADCTILSDLFHELCHAIDGTYCGQKMSEDCIEKIETFWFQILSDNDLFLERHELPDEIRIQGKDYKVIEDYEFDCRGNPSVSVELSTLTIKCVGDNIDKNVLKRNLITCIMQHLIGGGLFSDEEREELILEPFSSGLYQVLKDTKLNDLIREVC